MSAAPASFTRAEIEEFLVHEAALLDEWRLADWRSLFLEDCRYLVPNPAGDPYAPVDEALYLIADDGHHLTERVKRLNKRTAHSEYPRSRTRRLVSNVRILESGPDWARSQCGFLTFRTSQGRTDQYFGRHEHWLVREAGALRIREKRTILDCETLRAQGRLSIIV